MSQILKRIGLLFVLCVIIFPIVKVNATKRVDINISKGEKYDSLHYYKNGIEQPFDAFSYNATFENGITTNETYCIESSRRGPQENGTTYFKDNDFNISTCQTNFTDDCYLAFALSAAMSEDFSYLATETIIKLIAAGTDDAFYEGTADGYFDSLQGLEIRDPIYKHTAKIALEGKYQYCQENKEDEECQYVLYGDDDFQEELTSAINLFVKIKEEKSNIIWTPQISLSSASRNSDGKVTFVLNTNFNEKTKIIVPDSISGYSISSSIMNCDSGCTINIIVDVPANEECVNLSSNILFEDSRYSVGNISTYNSKGAIEQTFITFNPETVQVSYPIEYGEICEDNNKPDCCSNMDIIKDVPNNCNSSSQGMISDPQMCTILNSCDTNKKAMYDYTDEAGLNSRYCNMYCREKVDFTFMDKTEVIAGRQFKYDVMRNDTYLSTVVKATRECVVNFIDFGKWEEDYIEANNKVLDAWNNLKLWETRANHEVQHIAGLDEITCPACDDCCNGNPAEEDYESVENWQYYTWSNYSFNKTEVTGTTEKGYIKNFTNLTVNTSGMSGSSDGRCYCTSCQDAVCNPDVGKSAIVEASTAAKAYESAIKVREDLIRDLQNCNLLQGTEAYNYVAGYKINNLNLDITYDDKYSDLIKIESSDQTGNVSVSYYNLSEDDSNDKTDNSYWDKIENIYKKGYFGSYCSSCDANENINSTLETKEVDRWVCTGTELSANCSNEKIAVPITNAAKATTTASKSYQQVATFYTQLYTGIVSNNPTQEGYWVGLDNFIYPITINKKNGEYEVSVDYKFTDDLVRFDEGEFICAFEVINETTMYECDPRIENCYVECDPKEEVCDEYDESKVGLGMIVRSVDLTNLFPTNRAIGMNWKNATNIIKAIQSLGNEIWVDKQPQYVIELSPSNIRNIKNYNEYTDYMDYSINCDSSLNCTSNFLTSISTNTDYAYYVDISLGRNKKLDDFNNYYKYGR